VTSKSGSNIKTGYDFSFAPWLEKTMDSVMASILFAEFALMFGNTMIRSITGESILWSNEGAEAALVSLAFIGGAIAYHRGIHMTVHFLVDRFSAKWREYCLVAGHYIILITAGITLYLSKDMFMDGWEQLMPALEIRKSWFILPFIFGMILLVIFALRRILAYSTRTKVVSGLTVIALAAIWYLAQSYLGPCNGPGAVLFALFLLLVMVFFGVPIAFVLTIVSFMYLTSSQSAEIIAVPSSMYTGIGSFLLLAVPFFILVGNLMSEGGLTKPLADWVISLVGWIRGGLMQAVIVAMYIFSGISGSKIADVAAVGTAMKGMLKDQGYHPAESAAVFASAGIMGETIPPSLIMMVLASITSLSVGTLFIAGVVPAALVALCLMVFIYVRAVREDWPKGEKVSWGERGKLTILAFPALLIPIILIVGIVGGIATATEVSSFAIFYAALVAMILYRGYGLGGFWTILSHSAVNSGMLLLMIAAGAAFSRVLTLGGLPAIIEQILNNMGGTPAVFMTMTIVIMVIMGSVLEGMPSLLIFGPMLLPMALQYGINDMHLGIVILISMGIGTFIPPFGICYFVACSVLESTVEETTYRFWPYLLITFVALILIATFPWVSLILPKMLHLKY